MPLDEGQEPDAAVYDSDDPAARKPLTATEVDPTRKPEPEEPRPVEFDPRYREPLHGMLYLGAMKSRFHWLGHDFVIRTLTIAEYAEVALAAARYRDTDFAAKAYQAAVVAACLISVDGKDLPVVPVSADETDVVARVDYIMGRWFPPITDYVFAKFYELEVEVRDLLDAMGKVSG